MESFSKSPWTPPVYSSETDSECDWQEDSSPYDTEKEQAKLELQRFKQRRTRELNKHSNLLAKRMSENKAPYTPANSPCKLAFLQIREPETSGSDTDVESSSPQSPIKKKKKKVSKGQRMEKVQRWLNFSNWEQHPFDHTNGRFGGPNANKAENNGDYSDARSSSSDGISAKKRKIE